MVELRYWKNQCEIAVNSRLYAVVSLEHFERMLTEQNDMLWCLGGYMRIA